MDTYNPFLEQQDSRNYGRQNEYDDKDFEDDGDIEDVLREIHEHWDFMLESDFDPVTLALALMDDSSVGKGKDYKTFQRVLRKLDNAMKSIVDDYYKGFNDSIGTFGGVLQHINDSQRRVAQMKTSLRKCKAELLEKRTDLLNMWFKSQQHKEMLNILETIDEIRTTPEKLEKMMSNKHVLGAAGLLVQSLKTVNSKELKQIGALDDLRRTLTAMKNTLHDMLIEELHNHLYLKSAYCDNLWSAYVPDQRTLPECTIKPRSFGNGNSQSQTMTDTQAQANDMFAVDENDILREDTEKNPETDSYYYMEIIMEAFAVLGDIPTAMETIRERLPLEIHRLVDKTIVQVEERNMNQTRSRDSDEKGMDGPDMYSIDKANKDSKNEVLKDLLWTLYSKLVAVLRGFRFTETCARRIEKRLIAARELEDKRDALNIYHFHEIWRPIQSEIRSLLEGYLTSQERAPPTIQNMDDGASVFSNPRENTNSRQLFRFTDTPEDKDLDETYKTKVQQRLYNAFKKQVPGFNAATASKHHDPLLHSSIVDRYASDMASKGHKLLVKPDVYNVSVLLKPTMAFLERLREVFPSYDDQNAEGFGSFLDDFAVNVFLPRIEEKVMQLINHATVGMDAFVDDRNYRNYSKYPIVKSAVALISVIQSLCRTMHAMPFHTEEYVRMIEVVLLKFYEKCYQRFYSTVARSDSSNTEDNTTEMDISTSGDWAQDESLVALLAQNPFFNDDTRADFEFVKALNQAEITMELKLKGEKQLEAEELMFEPKRFIALGRLYHSLKWFVREIWELRTTSQPNKGTATNQINSGDKLTQDTDTTKNQESRRWSHDHRRESNTEDPGSVMLPLRGEASKRFDTLLTTYQQLAETCLFTLRLENRCHTIYYLEMAIREGNYYLEDETYEPDPYIITLNSELMEMDDCITASLPSKDQMFAFDGLPALIVHLLISEATYIKRMNANGVHKMMRNILALQQNLSNFVPPSQNAVMERAREYYQLLNLGSEGIIRSISENGPRFTFDEYRVILGLIHDIKKETDGEGESPNSNYSAWLLKLDDVMAKYEI